MRRKIELNFWALLRPVCWTKGHDWTPVLPGDAFSVFHRACARCLEDDQARRIRAQRLSDFHRLNPGKELPENWR